MPIHGCWNAPVDVIDTEDGRSPAASAWGLCHQGYCGCSGQSVRPMDLCGEFVSEREELIEFFGRVFGYALTGVARKSTRYSWFTVRVPMARA